MYNLRDRNEKRGWELFARKVGGNDEGEKEVSCNFRPFLGLSIVYFSYAIKAE
jgi:hypothetical protein